MISSLEKPLNSAAIGQVGKPLYGSKSDSLGNPLGAGQVIGTDGRVVRHESMNYIRFHSLQDFVINGTTHTLHSNWHGLLIFRSRDSASEGWDYIQLGIVSTLSGGSDIVDDLTNTDLLKTASIKIEGTGGSNYYRPYDTGFDNKRSWNVEGSYLSLRTSTFPVIPEFISGAGNSFSNDASLVGESDSNLKVTLYV